ncbi:hypothetical protein [Geitlerinema sp. PCC 9228]|jgi:hypothetical protein|uniref:hypothetical protein n=1 Tax=Geitlerinema sp. PCC 9228 TaxID=111611 RepID=UPI0008F98E86|nr:hypothetical protein [Geitlerinema sp. PCC 9228]
MKVLVTIPHFYNPKGDGRYGATKSDARSRLQALTLNLRFLRAHYGTSQDYYYYQQAPQVLPANQNYRSQLDVVICTTQNRHLLERLPIPSSLYKHHQCQAEPMFLGFECHHVLRENLGNYDYYCYIEDDLLLHDPLLFAKLHWFTSSMGNEFLLQPNRYELPFPPNIKKVYIDPEFETERNQEIRYVFQQKLTAQLMGQPIYFKRVSNPHAGCFFLNAQQMEMWAQQEFFGTPDTRFFGPLESAASSGIMHTFKVYKPAAENANFLEIQHFGEDWSQKLPHVKLW